MKRFLACTAISVVLLSGCSFMSGHEGIVKVDNTVITKADFDKMLNKQIEDSPLKNYGGSKNFLKSDENPMYVIFKEKTVNELIIKTLLTNEIKKRGIKATHEDIQAETKSIIDRVGSKEELNNILKQRGVSNAEFNDDLKSQICIKKLISAKDTVNVSDTEAQRYYNSHINQFKHGEQVRASHILIATDTLQIIRNEKEKNKNITPDELNKKVEEVFASQKAKAEAILAEVKANPAKFEQIAKRSSDDKMSGQRGGELGYFPKEAMVPEFSKAAFSMKPNTISQELVKTSYGYHIIKVTDRTEAGITPFAKVKDEIKFYIQTSKQVKVLKSLTDGLMKNAKIEYLNKEYKPQNDIFKKISETTKK